jgi:cholesterol transport system auxiliary component
MNMRDDNSPGPAQVLRAATAAALLAAALAGCAGLPGTVAGPPPQTYVLSPRQAGAPALAGSGPVLVVFPPQARPGYDTARMVYTRRPHELAYFARSQWADLPTAMLGPALVDALSASGRFRAVVAGPASVGGELGLDVRIVSLQQEFGAVPSRARVALRAQLIDLERRSVLATRSFEAVRAAPSEDPYGGVLAINQALEPLLDQLVRFCASRGAPEQRVR